MDIKKEFLKTLAGIGFVLVLFWTIVYFQMNPYQIWGFLMCIQIAIMLWQKSFTVKKLVKRGIYIAGIILLLRWINGFGAIGYVLAILIIVALILWRKWGKYIETKQHIEKMIWGKPLNEFKTGKDIPKVRLK